jgi:hypothetical protein
MISFPASARTVSVAVDCENAKEEKVAIPIAISNRLIRIMIRLFR